MTAAEPTAVAFLLRQSLGAAVAGAWFSLKIAVILVPAVVGYELLAPRPIFKRWGAWLGPRLGRLGMSPPCTLPLAAGLFLGLTYGAGFIIPISEERGLDPEEIQSVGLFLVNCHAVIEDTLLFALIGARGPAEIGLRMALLAGLRLALAIGVTSARVRLRGGPAGRDGALRAGACAAGSAVAAEERRKI